MGKLRHVQLSRVRRPATDYDQRYTVERSFITLFSKPFLSASLRPSDTHLKKHCRQFYCFKNNKKQNRTSTERGIRASQNINFTA